MLTVTEHLEELRRRLGISLLAFVIAAGISLSQAGRLIAWLKRPADPLLARLAFFSPTEPIAAYAKVIALAALILSLPVLLWQVWAFVRPGLTATERMRGLGFVWWGCLNFLLGAAFAYYVLLPASLKVLLGIGSGLLEPIISIDRYLGFVTTLVFWCGAVFELPVVIVLLARIGIVTPEWLSQQRSYAILILVTLAAIVTPTTDAVTLILLSIPLIGLYELSILMARLARPRR